MRRQVADPFNVPAAHADSRRWQHDAVDVRALRESVRGEALPVVVAGDLNADRDLPLFGDLLDEGLRDAAEERGRGLSRTWPQRLPVLALDHVLVRDGEGAALAVLDQAEAALPGSDHRAVVADLAVVPGPVPGPPRGGSPSGPA